MYMTKREYNNLRGGFIHVPFDTSQVLERPSGTASMPVATIAKAIEYALEAIVLNDKDIAGAAGATH